MAGKYFLIAVVLLLGAVRDSSCADSPHLSSGEMLEFSLLSLKDSCRQLTRENKWLLSETQVYRQNIQYLRNELELLEKEKESFFRAGNSSADANERLGENRTTAHKPGRVVSVLQEDIRRLQQQINSLSEKSLKKAFQEEKEALKREQAHLRQKLFALQGENERLDKEFSPLKEALADMKRRPPSPTSSSKAGLSAPR